MNGGTLRETCDDHGASGRLLVTDRMLASVQDCRDYSDRITGTVGKELCPIETAAIAPLAPARTAFSAPATSAIRDTERL